MSQFDAVIFDLFGTLVPSYPPLQFRRSLQEVAAVLGVDFAKFCDAWSYETRLNCDVYETVEANIRAICSALGHRINAAALRAAVETRVAFSRMALLPRDGTVAVLVELKSRGFRLGLASDCSAEVPAIWQETDLTAYFNATAFSCIVGAKKPDPRMYRFVYEKLGVAPERCLYVGDGFSHELSGAKRLGMHAVLINVSGEEREDSPTCEAPTWQGMQMTALSEVLEIADFATI